jgi:hypothetical protein
VRLKRLASDIDALVRKDEEIIRRTEHVARQRRTAAAILHRTCSEFVADVNALLTSARLELDPPDFQGDHFVEDRANLFQINVRGRIVQIEFQSTEPMISTEEFRVPYILQGQIRCFNQDLLDRASIQEQQLFYTLEKSGPMWRFFDPRTYRTGPCDVAFLIGLFEQLV